MIVEEISSIPTIETQTTIVRNIEEITRENEKSSQEQHIRERTIKIAYLHFLQCQPFIV